VPVLVLQHSSLPVHCMVGQSGPWAPPPLLLPVPPLLPPLPPPLPLLLEVVPPEPLPLPLDELPPLLLADPLLPPEVPPDPPPLPLAEPLEPPLPPPDPLLLLELLPASPPPIGSVELAPLHARRAMPAATAPTAPPEAQTRSALAIPIRSL
jgi:hypothetical protein